MSGRAEVSPFRAAVAYDGQRDRHLPPSRVNSPGSDHAAGRPWLTVRLPPPPVVVDPWRTGHIVCYWEPRPKSRLSCTQQWRRNRCPLASGGGGRDGASWRRLLQLLLRLQAKLRTADVSLTYANN